MPLRDLMRELLDPSSEALLAEHERLSSLYLHNAEMGERRTSLYLTIVSVSTVALFGLAQFRVDMTILLWPAVALLAVMLVMGVLTFQRLIERRIRGMEYLRAINRIHRYFVDHDPSLETYYYWAPCDDVPFRGGREYSGDGVAGCDRCTEQSFCGNSRWGDGIYSAVFPGFGDICGLGYSGRGHHLDRAL